MLWELMGQGAEPRLPFQVSWDTEVVTKDPDSSVILEIYLLLHQQFPLLKLYSSRE